MIRRLRTRLAVARASIRLWWLDRTALTPARDLDRALKRYASAQGISTNEALQHLARMNPVRGKSKHVLASRRERRARTKTT